MNYKIRKATVEDADGKGYVHYISWKESYSNIFSKEVMDKLSLDRSIRIAKEHPENTLVAVVDNKIVGFASYLESRDEDTNQSGEIMALYVLSQYQRNGIGKALMNACLSELKGYQQIILWVLKENKKAINFYFNQGFTPDGKEKIFLEQPAMRLIKII